MADNKKRDNEDVPWGLLITVMAVLLTFLIVMPIIGYMILDVHFATQAAVHEVKKMRQLRKEILEERLYGK